MAISLKATGTWARMVTDGGTVAIPGTPAAGDRMYLWGSWKTYSITVATPSGWTLLDDFSDGTTAAGNGTGSVHNAVYYRDWQSGDGDPVIDYSAAPTEGHWVIQVWQKDAGEVWDTPLSDHAGYGGASANFSITSSGGMDVPSGSVIMGLVGFRDDSGTMTRSSAAIDGSTIVFNGNYVESPATHFSSTTGQDMSGDLGHRFVTTGALNTILLSGTLAAAETGTGTFVVQGVSTPAAYLPIGKRQYPQLLAH